jgi:predicted transport protein
VIKVYISISPDAAPDSPIFRDVRNIGHYGMGDTEARYGDADQLGEIMSVVGLAYEQNR